MGSRLFFGVFPPPEILHSLPPLRSHLPSFRELPPHNRHITLFFLGNLEKTRAESLYLECQRKVLPYPPFSTSLTIPGVFPGLRSPRVLWIGVSSHPQWIRLAEIVAETFSRWVPPLTPSFTPHLTLGRWKHPPPPHRVEELLRTFPKEGEYRTPWEVKEVLLVQSQLTPQGPIYTPLVSLPLRSEREFKTG